MGTSLKGRYFRNCNKTNDDIVNELPISLKVVLLYSMLISKKYLNLNTFSLGDDSSSRKDEGGALVYYKTVSSILGKNKLVFDKLIMQGIKESRYEIVYVNTLFDVLNFTSTSFLGCRYDKGHPTNHYIKGMSPKGTFDSSRRILSTKDIPVSTVVLKTGIDVDYCLKELYSILPTQVIEALQNKETIKLVLGNQIEILLPRIIEDYKTVIGQKSVNAKTLQK